MNESLELGKRGEIRAWGFLKEQGYALLEKNCRTRFGEIDVVAQKGDTLVFIEIKTRRSDLFGLPAEAVDWKKRQKMARSAQAFLQARGLEDRPARFDILSIVWEGTGEPAFSLFEEAFTLDEA